MSKNIVLWFFFSISVKCSSTEFRCANDNTCIRSSKRCNGYNDCGDNSDERNCGGKLNA